MSSPPLRENHRPVRWREHLLALPWVYDTLRPIVAGGIDYAKLAAFCRVRPDDRVLDLGCGTGSIVPFLDCQRYLGIDVDGRALVKARRYLSSTVDFFEGDDWETEVEKLAPTIVLMVGVVHHLPDEAFAAILSRLRNSVRSVFRIAAVEVSYFHGRWVNNLLSRLDRGQFVRHPSEYEALFQRNGLSIVRCERIATRLAYVEYLGFQLQG